MSVEIIPFDAFMAGSSIAPSFKFASMVDGGLTFFVGTGAVLLGLIALEKMGFTVNEGMVRAFVLSGLVIAALWTIAKNPLFRSLVVGF